MDFVVADIAALLQVILIDLALAGDNAVAVGLAAAGLPAHQQRRAIFWGIVMALVLRILFAGITIQLLAIPGLLLVGGLLLFWVAWRMWSDLKKHEPVMVGDPAAGEKAAEAVVTGGEKPKTFQSALFTIVLADVSMSLDNVLAVAAVSRHNEVIMAFGLILSVVLMGVAAAFIARIITKYPWIAVVGIVIIVFAGIRMVWEDAHNFFPAFIPGLPSFLGGH
ncbi:MAG: YjbE family putative metal transport protein [Hyphomonadaceae bacterium]|nr:YjbE family putative metal transport protein [Hyphomonadaceae bacterium]MBX3511941.1 YjbE family putative metal transport protein [Hyphomonadaceae bacterium]